MKTMRSLPLLLLAGGFLIIGMLFYSWYNELVILRIPSKTSVAAIQKDLTVRKNTKLSYAYQGKFKSEEKELLHTANNPIKTLNSIITAWLTLLDEEELWPKKIALQSVLIDASGGDIFLSFDQSPFSPDQSTLTKLMWVEGLLKTIRESSLGIKAVRLLVQNKPLQDSQLDFTHSWPITGYLKK